MDSIHVEELETIARMLDAYPLMHQLRDALSIQEYKNLLEAMIPNHYRMFGMYEGAKLIALAGTAVQTNLYYGKHLWVYDLVTDVTLRSKGYGRKMMEFLEDHAKKEGCCCVALSSGLQREKTHQFYRHAMHYDTVSYVFKKTL